MAETPSNDVLYSIKGWNEHFEKSDTRKRKAALWVAIPTKHDGKGFRRLMRMHNGPALYGAWILVVQVAAKCPTKGVLADENGPLTAEDLEIKTDCPASLFTEAFNVLSSKQIGWLEAKTPADSANAQAESAATNKQTNKQVDIHTYKFDSIEIDRSRDHEAKAKAEAVEASVLKDVSCKAKDRGIVRKASLAVAMGIIPENWVRDSAAAVKAKGGTDKPPIAYFTACLKAHCAEGGIDFKKVTEIVLRTTGPPSEKSDSRKGIPSPDLTDHDP